MNYADTETAAAALFDGGWRAGDEAELITEYEMTKEEAAAICEHLKRWEG